LRQRTEAGIHSVSGALRLLPDNREAAPVERHSITCKVEWGDEAEAFFAEAQRQAEADYPNEVKRFREMSRLSGLEVTYDLTMFDMDWSPIYWHASDAPVAWIHNKTGERRNGGEHPEA
jgi:hypothetical protein